MYIIFRLVNHLLISEKKAYLLQMYHDRYQY